MKYIIITGATRGLGKALAEGLAHEDNTLLLIGRDTNGLNEVTELARKRGSTTYSFCLDLFFYDKIRYLMDEIITVFNKNIHQPGDQIILVNNASIIEPINRFDLLSEKDIEKNLTINCLAPVILINNFLAKTGNLNIERRIINISSGVINNPIYGWSLYSASKSAVHSIIKTIKRENDGSLIKVVSFDPGVMNTNMQGNIRGVTKEECIDVNIFREYYKNNQLRDTKDVASIIITAYINNWHAKSDYEKISQYEE